MTEPDQYAAARAREAVVLMLWGEGVTETRALAEAVGVTPRTAARIVLRLGLREKTDHRSRIDYARMEQLAREGMPATWIAEECGVEYDTARRVAMRIEGHDRHVGEWRSVWQSIRQNEKMLELHYEIAPVWSASRHAGIAA